MALLDVSCTQEGVGRRRSALLIYRYSLPPRAIELQRRSRAMLARIKVLLFFSFPPFLAKCPYINPQPAHPP